MKNSCKLKRRYIIAVDPSGSYLEGNGTTGLAVLDIETNTIIYLAAIEAHSYPTWHAYYRAVWNKIRFWARDMNNNCYVIIEDYILYASKAQCQVNSRFETPKLIGYLQMKCYEYEIPTVLQRAVDVKNRWTCEVLEHNKYIIKVTDKKSFEHCHGTSGWGVTISTPDGGEYTQMLMSHHIDAIRHAVHFYYFGKEIDYDGSDIKSVRLVEI